MNQWELKANTRDRRQARENACDQVAIGFGFGSDWSRRWRELFKPITERSKAKPKQFSDYFRQSIENRSIVQLFLGKQLIGLGMEVSDEKYCVLCNLKPYFSTYHLWLTGVTLPWWNPELVPVIQLTSSTDRQHRSDTKGTHADREHY